jgi:hypothetical protein
MKNRLIIFIFFFIFIFLYDCPNASSAAESTNSDCSDDLINQSTNSTINTNNICIQFEPRIDLKTKFVTFNISFYKITLVFNSRSAEVGFFNHSIFIKPNYSLLKYHNFYFSF